MSKQSSIFPISAEEGCVIVLISLLFFTAPVSAAEVTLLWNANTEPDLLGYKVYYHPGPSAPPYEGCDATEGPSPVQVNAEDVTFQELCRYRLTGLKEGQTYHFVVTAVDRQGNESGYSGEACSQCGGNNGGGYGDGYRGSGCGGGCFIQVAEGH